MLERLDRRRARARLGGGEARIKAQHARGKLTARERIELLLDHGSFEEFDMFVEHRCADFGMGETKIPGDGVVTGWGTVNGRTVFVFAKDFTVFGGSLSEAHAQKITKVQDMALKNGAPIVGLFDAGGARIQEGIDSLSAYGQIFFRNVLLSGVVPQIAVIAGPCAGGAAYSPALMDFLIMVKGSANMFICGPEVIQAVTGQKCSMEEIGSATTHATISGNIHFVAENDTHAIQIARRLLSYLPSNNLHDPPHQPFQQIDLSTDPEMETLLPESSKEALEIHKVIGRLVDNGELLEVQAGWAQNIVIGLARIQGVVVGIVANNPAVKAGTLDIDSSDKGARFIRFCNVFNIPLVTLVDIPGFMPGLQQERGGIIRHGAKMLFAYASATVPKITVILRKAYGGAYLAMCSSDMGADFVFAWPTAEIAVMGAEGAVKVLYKREIAAAKDPKAKEAELVEEYRDKFCSPYEAAKKAMITDVIAPSETRVRVSLALRNSLTKRESRPPKKHGTIPL